MKAHKVCCNGGRPVGKIGQKAIRRYDQLKRVGSLINNGMSKCIGYNLRRQKGAV